MFAQPKCVRRFLLHLSSSGDSYVIPPYKEQEWRKWNIVRVVHYNLYPRYVASLIKCIFFQEFLDTVVLFSTNGRGEDKLRIVFDMCDTNENGLIDKGELQEMLTSLVEMAKTDKVRSEDVERLIDSMFTASGFGDKDVLTYEDFTAMMMTNGDFLTVGLDCKGAKHNFLDTTTNIAR